ncbi:MAG: ABC transporter permease [Deltaproteobacteria bacterium]|nr:ABC transporter permease [Deltaproteobacteria bacterium]
MMALLNILTQSSVLLIGATGMTLVLLTAGIDLSVGSIMFISAVTAGKLLSAGQSVGVAFLSALVVALIYGAINGFFVVRMRVMAFIVTLSTLYIGRGFGLWATETRAMNLPDSIGALGSARFLGLQFPVWVAAIVVVGAHVWLSRTQSGRQLYAIGQDREAARKAGIPVARLDSVVFLVCGLLAGLAGFVAIAQVGVVSPSLGTQRELSMIAASVLGGTSLFGGRGRVFPGTVVGALLITSVEATLNTMNVDPYLYPLVTAGIIFGAVAIDSFRNQQALRRALRRIRPLRA